MLMTETYFIRTYLIPSNFYCHQITIHSHRVELDLMSKKFPFNHPCRVNMQNLC